jgi:hypothetical protein
MMSRLTQTQTKRLCELAHLFRPTWDIRGIEATVRSVAERADGVDIARALLALCGDPAVKTPGMLAYPGRHWPIDDDGTPSLPPSNDIPCPVHPGQVHPCPVCRHESRPPTEREMQRLRELARAAAVEAKTARVPG